MRGSLHESTLMPIITLKINGVNVSCLVDTGFTGDIAIGLDTEKKLRSKPAGGILYSKTVGTDAPYRKTTTRVEWFGENRTAHVFAFKRSQVGPVDAIIGVHFLIGYILLVDFNEGSVVIKNPALREALP